MAIEHVPNFFGTEESYRYRTSTGAHTELPEYHLKSYCAVTPSVDYLLFHEVEICLSSYFEQDQIRQ